MYMEILCMIKVASQIIRTKVKRNKECCDNDSHWGLDDIRGVLCTLHKNTLQMDNDVNVEQYKY